MNIKILENEIEIGKEVSKILIENIKKNPKIVLGLATGSSPIKTYNFLVEDFKKNKTDWSNVITFNLDEYIGLDQNNSQSYYFFMEKYLLGKINIKKENIHIPIGTGNYEAFAYNYDNEIKAAGGIDIQILGLGQNGHIGFNEPPCDFNSKTQIVDLVPSTIEANARFFKSKKDVPQKAVSMGIKTIMQAKTIILIAFGEKKAKAIKELVEGKVSNNFPCTILQEHKNFILIIDQNAANLLDKN